MASNAPKKQPGQGTAGKSNLQPPIYNMKPPGTDKPIPSTQNTKPMKAPGSGTNGTSKGANKVSN